MHRVEEEVPDLVSDVMHIELQCCHGQSKQIFLERYS